MPPTPYPPCLTWDMICFQPKHVPLQQKRVPLQEKHVRFLVEERTSFSTKKLPLKTCNEVHRDSVGKYFALTKYLPNYRIYDIQELQELDEFFSNVYNQKKPTSGIYQHRWRINGNKW